MIGDEELTTRFAAPVRSDEQLARIEDIRIALFELAKDIDNAAPDSREKSLAIGGLEECLMWATAAIVHRAPQRSA